MPTWSFTCLLILLIFLEPAAGLASSTLPASAAWQSDRESVKIGVLAKRGREQIINKWSPTASYLSQTISGHHFTIVPLDFNEINSAVESRSIDFVLANPAFYVELEKKHGVSRIATLINQNLPGQQTTTFGGVIFSRQDRPDIQSLSDLNGKRFMAVDPRSFGGWLMARRELEERAIDPATAFISLEFGNTHDAVVYAVAEGQVDAGTVRSDTLERMTDEGRINLADFRILNPQQAPDFPFLLSTRLYPEWPMAVLASTPRKLARQVAAALMAMDENDPAAQAAKSGGWTIPLNYQPVHSCLLALRVAPYEEYGQFTFSDVLARYQKEIFSLMLTMIITILIALYIVRLNRFLQQKKNEVDELNRTLETRVEHRTKRVNTLLNQEIYLREILETVAAINELLITSPNLHALLWDSCRRLARHRHYTNCWLGLLKDERLTEVYGDLTPLPDLKLPWPITDLEQILPDLPTGQALSRRQSITIQRTEQTAGPKVADGNKNNAEENTQTTSTISIPLQAAHKGPALGVITVTSGRAQGFDQEEISMLEELAGDIGFAIASFRHKETVEQLELEKNSNYEETILSFVDMIDHRDTYTAGHTQRVAAYSRLIAAEMGYDQDEIQTLEKAAILHDIGKIATPDSVLLKPGTLTTQDYDLIKLHAYAGYEMLSRINIYKDLAGIIRHHHERHDGHGYPDGLQGEDIPPYARIITVADAFDAMTTNRIYKPRKEIRTALTELAELSGIQFHPAVVEAALKVLQDAKPPTTVSQLPETDLEKRRFAYFFNDKLTGLYNEDYLQILLQNNREEFAYRCLHSLHLKNLQAYNKVEGWEAGDRLCQTFSGQLAERYPDALLFRAYGNDFVVVAREHLTINSNDLAQLPCIQSAQIEIQIQHLDLARDTTYLVKKLDQLELITVP